MVTLSLRKNAAPETPGRVTLIAYVRRVLAVLPADALPFGTARLVATGVTALTEAQALSVIAGVVALAESLLSAVEERGADMAALSAETEAMLKAMDAALGSADAATSTRGLVS